ncbi:MAG TPA: gephyrin-like molybdotransferase Glp [Candidatus Xenobia bacterium]|nr:gephyrin-like molybdotransferase Glp [Candidatus Xenobia bacterium]
MLNYKDARQRVVAVVGTLVGIPATEFVELSASLGRVLAEDVRADRDYPPFPRSTRDGFAVRAGDITTVPTTLRRVGEVKAGEAFAGRVGPGECVQIMTGAPAPEGADAVVMIEDTQLRGDGVVINRSVAPGANIVPRGSEARAGARLLERGTRIGYTEISVLGQVGHTRVLVYRRPRVAVLSTGDEVVPAETTPGPTQIRNSNVHAMAAQVVLCGGEPVVLGNARDEVGELERLMRRGLEEDALVLTGGVSAGKYDLVEVVLRKLGAELHFDAVAIRPGRPTVFATCQSKPVFGLPGNPVSTMVTFELFVAPATALLSGAPAPPLQFLKARLAEPLKQTTRLTLFLPALLEGEHGDVRVRVLRWQGSGDVVAVAQGNCFAVIPEDAGEVAAGSWVDVLPRRR